MSEIKVVPCPHECIYWVDEQGRKFHHENCPANKWNGPIAETQPSIEVVPCPAHDGKFNVLKRPAASLPVPSAHPTQKEKDEKKYNKENKRGADEFDRFSEIIMTKMHTQPQPVDEWTGDSGHDPERPVEAARPGTYADRLPPEKSARAVAVPEPAAQQDLTCNCGDGGCWKCFPNNFKGEFIFHMMKKYFARQAEPAPTPSRFMDELCEMLIRRNYVQSVPLTGAQIIMVVREALHIEAEASAQGTKEGK